MVSRGFQLRLLFGVFPVMIILGGLMMPANAQAQDVSHCMEKGRGVKPTTGKLATYLKNTCLYPVFGFWCQMGPGDASCGEKKFFRTGRKFESKIPYFNRFSLPDNVEIHFAACLGTRRNVSLGGVGSNKYSCRNTKPRAPQKSANAVIKCGQKSVAYHWRQQKTSGKFTVIRLKSAEISSWVKIDTAEFKRFSARKNSPAPAAFQKFLCNNKPAKPKLINRLIDSLRKKGDEKYNRSRTKCQQTLHNAKDCFKALSPGISNGGTGRKG